MSDSQITYNWSFIWSVENGPKGVLKDMTDNFTNIMKDMILLI